jgi:hypothetical protein
MSIRKPQDDPADPRREFLVRALQLGLLAGGLGWQRGALADLFGRIPARLPEGKSIFELSGDVQVNGQPAHRDTVIGAGDKLTAGSNAHAVFAVGDSAFILRGDSELHLSGTRLLVRGLRLVNGALLSVVGKRSADSTLNVQAPTTTVGIRGTGFYTEADAEKTYFCTCYGQTSIVSSSDPTSTETIASKHHDAPRYILAAPADGKYIVPAPFLDHTDLELMTLEALVGRQVPFSLGSNLYDGPRREDY